MKNTPKTKVKNTPFLATKSTRILMGLVAALLTIAGAGSARAASISWDFDVVPLDWTADQGAVMAYVGDGQNGISVAATSVLPTSRSI